MMMRGNMIGMRRFDEREGEGREGREGKKEMC